MDKHSLPKLETDGFVTGGAPAAGPTWRQRAAQLLRKTGRDGKAETRMRAEDMGEVDIGYKRLLVKTGVCAAVAIAILVISSVNTPVANEITQAVNQTVNHEFDIDEEIGRLKFVKNLGEEAASVFSPAPGAAAVYPADGDVVTRFGEGGSVGVRMTAQSDRILCIAKGTVNAVGQIGDAGYVTVVLDSGETVAFHNVAPAVQINDIVLPGQTVGTLSGTYLYFEMRTGDDPIDPLAYIEQQAAMVLQ